MEVRFFNMLKRENSTKRPTFNPLLSVDALMRNDSSIIAPVLELHKTAPINTRVMNYVFIPAYDRYYFVKDWVWETGLWLIYLSEDVLASWKDTIGNYHDYVERAADLSVWDGTVIDRIYPMTGKVVVDRKVHSSPWTIQVSEEDYQTVKDVGIYVIDIPQTRCEKLTGTYRNRHEFIAFAPQQFKNFLWCLFSDAYVESTVGNIEYQFFPSLKSEIQPLQFIRSIRWYPFVPDFPTSYTGRIIVGRGMVEADTEHNIDFDPHYAFNPLLNDGCVYEWDDSFELSVEHQTRHPQSNPNGENRGAYLNHPPYTSYSLFVPPFGTIELDAEALTDCNQIDLHIDVDMCTGEGILTVYGSEKNGELIQRKAVLAYLRAKIGKECSIGQVTNPELGFGDVLASIAGAMPSEMTNSKFEVPTKKGGDLTGYKELRTDWGNFGANASLGLVNTVGAYANSQIPRYSSVGTSGGIGTLIGRPTLTSTFHLIVAEDIEQKGRPCCKRIEHLNSLRGYILISDPDFECSGTADEILAIRNYMAGGFYYE